MKESELKVFVEGTMSYFEQVCGSQPEIGVPYPKNAEFVLSDYTGAIGISGARKGCIYITADRGMLQSLVSQVDPSTAPGEDAVLDMVGEVANNIAGNAQSAFGAGFMISVPLIITGKPTGLELPLRIPVFIIPFSWQGGKASLVVGIE